MAHLLYYQQERAEFKEAFEKKLTIKGAEIVFAKLCRHFKISPRLEWTSGRNHPHACGSYLVRLNVDMNDFGCLCHELAHTLHLKNRDSYDNDNFHGKKHHRIMKRMINYCLKKQWFEQEITKRTAPKVEKPAPSQEEIKLKELTRIEQNIQRYEKKIKFYQKKLSKAKRSYNLRLTHLKKHTQLNQTGGQNGKD